MPDGGIIASSCYKSSINVLMYRGNVIRVNSTLNLLVEVQVQVQV